ncbi:hypothetical protein BpHYR1_037126 [Brachionus plicatilis]|uniref:Uncharacterized protein n=1 Tax=Brachionus plicatilis TaxID=10195 RepID=A0A3M7SYP2_BRAPC|nr:hypothetical protein BpHYR1_037126 [Brachionus plicatilis]
MDVLCSNLCFIQPKYYNKDYMEIGSRFKLDIETLLKASPDDDAQFLRFLLRFFEILETDSGLRSNLLRFRNELEMYKSNQEPSETRQRLIELSIQTASLVHYGTLYCTSKNNFESKCNGLKDEFQAFKDWLKANRTALKLNTVEKFYVSYLYKIPKLMKVKRGFKKVDRNRASLNSHV